MAALADTGVDEDDVVSRSSSDWVEYLGCLVVLVGFVLFVTVSRSGEVVLVVS